MKKTLFILFSLVLFGNSFSMEPEEEKQATVQITHMADDVTIPFEDFGSAISGSLEILSEEALTTLGSALSGYLGETVIVNKKDLVVKAKEHLQEKAVKKKELQDKTLAFVHGWMARQTPSKTRHLKFLHELKKEEKKEVKQILKEHRRKLEQED